MRTKLLIPVMLLITLSAFAQQEMDFPQALALAEERSTPLRVARQELKSLEGRQRIMENWQPDISASVNLNRNDRGLSATEGEKWTLSGGVNLGLQLEPEDFTQDPTLSLLIMQKELQIQEICDTLRGDLKKLLYQIQSNHRRLLLQEEGISLARERLETIEVRYQQGLSSDLDLLTARISATRDFPALKKARAEQEKRWMRLQDFLGLPPGEKPQIQLPPPMLPPEEEEKKFLYDSLSTNRAMEGKVLEQRLASLGLITTKKDLLYPRFQTRFSWSSTLSSNLEERNWEAEPLSDNLSLDFTLTIPLSPHFPYSRERRVIEEQKDSLRRTDWSQADLAEDLNRELRALLMDIEVSQSNIEMRRLSRDLQEQNFKSLEGSYQQGRTSLLDLENSRQALEEAEINLEEEKLNLQLLLIDLENLVPGRM